MYEVREHPVSCPFCGESIVVLIDCSVPTQSYIEDCQVCCRPMQLDVLIDQEGDIQVSVRSDSD